MPKLTTLFGILLLVALLIGLQLCSRPAGPSVFVSQDFATAQARAAAASAPRLLVLNFTAQNCEPCLDMERQVWNNPELVHWLDQRALAVKIDFDLDKGHARALGVGSIPALVLLDGTKVLTRIEGVRSARELIDRFNAAAPEGKISPGPASPPAASAPAPRPHPLR